MKHLFRFLSASGLMLGAWAWLLAVPSAAESQQSLTLIGCLQQTADSPEAFVLRPSNDTAVPWRGNAPVYRVTGANLKAHVGHTVELTGSLTLPADEPGVDAALARITPERTVLTTLDVKAAPQLNVTNVKMRETTCTVGTWTAAKTPGGREGAAAAAPEPATPAPHDASATDISEEPARFYGKTVRVRDGVARLLGPRIFTLDEDKLLGLGKDVLVIAPKGTSVQEDQDVAVTGIVRQFIWAEMEKELFDIDFKREWQAEFHQRPVIVASSVQPAK